jgi:hypothetical protein
MRCPIQVLPQTIEDLNYVNLIAVAEREISKNRHLPPPFGTPQRYQRNASTPIKAEKPSRRGRILGPQDQCCISQRKAKADRGTREINH